MPLWLVFLFRNQEFTRQGTTKDGNLTQPRKGRQVLVFAALRPLREVAFSEQTKVAAPHPGPVVGLPLALGDHCYPLLATAGWAAPTAATVTRDPLLPILQDLKHAPVMLTHYAVVLGIVSWLHELVEEPVP